VLAKHGQKQNKEIFMDIINNRRSVRSFTDQEVEKENVLLLLRAAMQAPSAHNQQPWHFLVVQDKDMIRKLRPSSPMFSEATLAIIVLLDKTNVKREMMAPQDLSAATQNILLKATELGLGSCWCGVYPLEERMNYLSEVIMVSKQYEVFSLIALGYPKNPTALSYIDRFDPNKVSYEKF
jgi:nitroreductase